MIKDGDLCFTYRLGDLRQGDEIVYKVDGDVRFGRIIAFGGDTVDILNEYISVGGYGLFEDVLYPTTSEGAQITFPYNANGKTIAVYAGPTPEKIVFSGDDISDTETTDKKFEIAFAQGDSTTLAASQGSSDYVKNLDSGEKYAKKTATLSFANVEFDEPGIYRYVITETNDSAQGITYDSDLTRILDVYV